jgi:hypothetical protein
MGLDAIKNIKATGQPLMVHVSYSTSAAGMFDWVRRQVDHIPSLNTIWIYLLLKYIALRPRPSIRQTVS